MSDRSGSDKVMTKGDEAKKVWSNLKGDANAVAQYVVNRCGDFTYDREREQFIAAFLWEAANNGK